MLSNPGQISARGFRSDSLEMYSRQRPPASGDIYLPTEFDLALALTERADDAVPDLVRVMIVAVFAAAQTVVCGPLW